MAFDLETGFRVGPALLRWGTTIDDAADMLGVPRAPGRGTAGRRIELACAATYGLPTFSAELTGPAGDRPVTALKYELAAPAGVRDPDALIWLDPLTAAFGKPSEASHREVPDQHAESSVRFYASWNHGNQSVGLSLYGASRMEAHGPSAGCLWLSWSVDAAAQPFLDEWRRRAATLASEAGHHSGILTFRTTEPQLAALVQHGASRDGLHALQAPHILSTPGPIARLLGTKGFGFWRSRDHSRWYASTNWDTVGFDFGAPVAIDVYDVKPAKGGGYVEISVDGWRVRDVHGSAAMTEAVAALRTIPGVTVREESGYDC